MMDHRNQTQELNNIPISTVGAWLGLELPHNGSTHCPFSDHQDKRPSFAIDSSRNSWICYGCTRRGGAIDLVKEYLRLDFMAAKRWLLGCIGKEPSKQYRSKQLHSKSHNLKNQRIDRSESTPDHALYGKFASLCAIDSNGREYLTRRGISEATISSFKIGQLNHPKSILKTMLDEFGYSRVMESGLLSKQSTEESCRFVFPENSIIFPFIEAGNVTYLQARYIGNRENIAKWINLNGRQHRVYNDSALSESAFLKVAICEGIMDTLSALELGLNAIGLMGVSARLTVHQIKNLKGKKVDILIDWDEPGNKRARTLQNELKHYGIVSTRKARPSPTAKDLNDFLMEKRNLI